MEKIFNSNSTLIKSKLLVIRLQLNPVGPFDDSILLAKIVGDIPRCSPGSSILDMPRHEKKNSTFNFNVRVRLSAIVLDSFPEKNF